MKRRLLISLVVLAAVFVAVLGLGMTYTPTKQYDPYAKTTPAEVKSAAQAVEDSLLRAGHLPTPGTTLEWRNGALQWRGVSESAPKVSQAKVQSVQVTSGAPLLTSLLDDDPTYRATVETRVVTSDGQETILSVALWDYGLLTPWSIRLHGDGWKPLQVRWP
ncbi:MAG TPA: hypothetical protein PLJ35_21100 [Anaerolineae bacterium]|nr:hypothetical protein [Anaerolineae bacterium]HOR01321.1 hypothetical protein [Anaerolineae bacterium]HPL29578.1 hypothetical protein [Anaerolineae bacterium]